MGGSVRTWGWSSRGNQDRGLDQTSTNTNRLLELRGQGVPSPGKTTHLPSGSVHSGIPAENHGRELYLKLRNEHLEPDEKTEFTQTESQEIGWRIREYEKGKLKSEFAFKDHSQESHRPNGAFTRDGYPLVRDGTENEGIPKADLTLIS